MKVGYTKKIMHLHILFLAKNRRFLRSLLTDNPQSGKKHFIKHILQRLVGMYGTLQRN